MTIRERAESILSSSNQKERDIIALFESIGVDLPVIPLTLQSGSKLIRGTINWVKGHFDRIDQLSYRPADQNTQYLRASIPGKTMFYVCPFTHSRSFENGVFLPRITSLMEIRSIITDAECDGIQRVTFSRWDSNQNIRLFAVPFLTVYSKPCDEILDIQNRWANDISLRDYSPASIELMKYISEDISKRKENRNDYMFTALFIDWFLSVHQEYAGVFYPSVQTEGEGANIAFRPDVVDSGLVSFIEATECWVIKRGMLSEVIMSYQLVANEGKLECQALDVLKQLAEMSDSIDLKGLPYLN